MGFGGFLKKALNPMTAIRGAVGGTKSLLKGDLGGATKSIASGGMLGGGGKKPGGFGGFMNKPGMKERGALLQGAGQAMQGGGLGKLASGLQGFRNWKSQQAPKPGGAQAGGWNQPQAQLPGSQMQAPQIDPSGGGGGFQAPPPIQQLGAPQMGGGDPNPWAPQPPKPTGGQGPGIQGRGGFIPGGMGRGTGSMGGGFDF